MRKTKEIQSDLNRAKAQLHQLENSTVWDLETKDTLRPHYQKTVKKLEYELSVRTKDIEVHDPQTVSGFGDRGHEEDVIQITPAHGSKLLS